MTRLNANHSRPEDVSPLMAMALIASLVGAGATTTALFLLGLAEVLARLTGVS